MSSVDRRSRDLAVELDRMRLVVALAAQLRGQAHRLRAHGLDDAAGLLVRHIDDLDRAMERVDESVAQLLAILEPGLEDTIPGGMIPRS